MLDNAELSDSPPTGGGGGVEEEEEEELQDKWIKKLRGQQNLQHKANYPEAGWASVLRASLAGFDK